MSANDLELNCGVRNVLSRHWIDLTKTSFYARKGHVHLGGEVKVIGQAAAKQETAQMLKLTETEIRRLPEVRTISFEFTNWVRDGAGVWICLEKRREDEAEATPASDAGASAAVDQAATGQAA